MDFINQFLPSSFEYELKSIVGDKSNFAATLRIKCATKGDLLQWKSEFESITSSRWQFRSSKTAKTNSESPQKSGHFRFRQDYICARSKYRKKATDDRNTDCRAKLALKVGLLQFNLQTCNFSCAPLTPLDKK